jgi:hypothetical protein
MQRRALFTSMLAGLAIARIRPAAAQQTAAPPFVERPQAGTPHKGKVLAAIQPHADDIALYCAGTVAQLLQEGYTGYMIRATNDDMGDEIGEPGTIGENVPRNERELICRLIFLWGHDEENPDHYVAGRVHDYPEQFAAGLQPRTVAEKYYYARHPEITRVVDISATVEKKIDANLCNVAKGPGGHHGSKQRAELAREGKKLPLPGNNDRTADRNYIREFLLAGDRELGRRYGVEYAEAFHYIGPPRSRVQDYVKQHAVPLE